MSRPKIYRWGDWQFEPVEYRLLHAGQQVTLSMKTLDLLALLIARAPRLATKEEILSAVWPDAAVEEGNIAFHVNALRKALDEDGDESCIETVRGRGYRFVAAVTATPVIIPSSTAKLDLPPAIREMPIAAAAPAPAPAPVATPRRSIRPAVLIALAIVIAGGVGLAVFNMTRPAPVLIAPFEVDAAAAGADFGQEATKSVVAALTQSGVSVVEGSDDAGANAARDAASRQGAELLLTGQIAQTDDKRWDVSLRLQRVSDGLAVWAWKFEIPPEERPSQLVEQIAKRTADGLKSYLSLSGTEPVSR
jgi:DNA-binding winged helix-turn-helix (wHTH) protein